MRQSNLVFTFAGALSLASGCATKDRGPETKEVRSEEARKEGTKEERKGIVERVRERIGLGGCDLDVVAKSPGAVGDPCRTTAEFMRAEGLSSEEMAQVNRFVAALEARGGTSQAH